MWDQHDHARRYQMSGEERKCTKCGGLMEDGFLYSYDSVGEGAVTVPVRTGWMAGDEFQTQQVGVLILKRDVVINQRRNMTASRCTSCGLVELYAR
jgi:hypothetical protein